MKFEGKNQYLMVWMDLDGSTHTETIREADLGDTIECMDERIRYGANCIGYTITALGRGDA